MGLIIPKQKPNHMKHNTSVAKKKKKCQIIYIGPLLTLKDFKSRYELQNLCLQGVKIVLILEVTWFTLQATFGKT